MTQATSVSFTGGPEAVRYATGRSFLLLLPLVLVALTASLALLPTTPKVAQHRVQAVRVAWGAGGELAQERLSKCLNEKGVARARDVKMFAHLNLLHDVKDCEESIRGVAFSGPMVFGEEYDGPSAEQIDQARAARQAVFNRTFGITAADLRTF